MRSFAIIGHPLGHTMSLPIHNRLFALSGEQDVDYQTMELLPEQLEAALPRLFALDGLNVTIPHKVELAHRCDRLDESARRYGAVNVVAVQDGQHVGFNTDCYGFTQSVERLGADLSQPVCVLGAGGVGRMFAIESALHGASVTLAVRESAFDLARKVREEILALCPQALVTVRDITRLAGGKWHLLINATPAGMYPHVDEMAVEAEILPGCELVFESIYNPVETTLMTAARAAGCRVAGGMDMLVWQAVRAHEIWDGACYQRADIDALIVDMQAEVVRQFAVVETR